MLSPRQKVLTLLFPAINLYLAWFEEDMARNLKDLKKELWIRAETLIGTLAVLTLSLLPQVSPVTAAPSDVQVVESYDPAQLQFAENVAVDYKGNIYVSLALAGAIAKRTPSGQQTIIKLPVSFPEGGPAGVAVDIQGRVYVVNQTDIRPL